jgi:hypothetical protein
VSFFPVRYAIAFSLLTGWCWTAAAQDSVSSPAAGITAFPRERIFPKFLADGTVQQFSLAKDAQTRRIIGSIGGVQRLFQFTHSSGIVFQVGAGATVYASFIKTPSVLQVLTADFFVDFPLEIKISERLALRTGWGHYSAHLVDDGIEMLKLASINYAKDYIPLFAAIELPSINVHAYGGVRLDYFTIPEREAHYVLQAGAEGGNLPLSSWARLYGAIDIKVKSEASWGTTQSYQVGVKFLEEGTNAFRLAYTYRSGIEERGQFYRNHTTLSLLGVYFDF